MSVLGPGFGKYYHRGSFVHVLCPKGRNSNPPHHHVVTERYFNRARTQRRRIVCAKCLSVIKVFDEKGDE